MLISKDLIEFQYLEINIIYCMFQTTRASKITTKTTTAASTTKNIKTQEKDMSTKTTLSVSLGGSTSVKVSTEANTSIPDVRLKIKSQDGERSHNNNTENEDEVKFMSNY